MKIVRAIWKMPLGKAGLTVISLSFLTAVFAYIIVPDPSPHANRMNVQLALEKPGFQCDFLVLSRNFGRESSESLFRRLIGGKTRTDEWIPVGAYRKGENEIYYIPYPEQDLSDTALVHRVDFADYGVENAEQLLRSKTFYLGTDRYGRDMLSRLTLGTRISLAVGSIAVLISLIIGIPLGAAAGYFGGWIDKVVMWLINVVWSVPTLLMVIAITLALGKGFWQVFVAVGLTMWVEVARVVRGQVISLRKREYAEAALVLGYSHLRILRRHILPNAWAPVIVISAANFATAILVESGLSFLGIGAQPPMPSWGGMIKDHYAYIVMDKAHLAIVPGMVIMLLVLAFMVLGNTLRDVLDVRGQGV